MSVKHLQGVHKHERDMQDLCCGELCRLAHLLFNSSFSALELLLQIYQSSILELSFSVQITVPLSTLNLQIDPVNLLLHTLQPLRVILFTSPLLCQVFLQQPPYAVSTQLQQSSA